MYGMQMPGSMPFIQTMPTMQAMPTSTAHSSGEMSLLLSESKIHHGEIKSAVTRVTERIDDLIHKVMAHYLYSYRQIQSWYFSKAIYLLSSIIIIIISRMPARNQYLCHHLWDAENTMVLFYSGSHFNETVNCCFTISVMINTTKK